MRKLSMLVAAVACAAGVSAQAQTELKFGAMPLNTWWYIAGASITSLVQPQLPAGTKIEVLARGGGIANPVVVNENKAQVALANVATSAWAWQGEPELYKGKPHRDIRALVGGINSVWIVAMLKEDYIQRTGNDTLEKALADKNIRIIMKPAGSSVPPVARMIMESMNTNPDKIKAGGGQIIQVDATQTSDMLREGRADLYFESAAKDHPAVTEVTLTANVRFVDLPDKTLAYLAQRGLKPSPMPQFFKGQSGATKSVDMGTNIIANKDLSDAVAYAITKTVVENKDKLVQSHKAFEDFVPADAWKAENLGIPLHPGAEKYYRERGWIKS